MTESADPPGPRPSSPPGPRPSSPPGPRPSSPPGPPLRLGLPASPPTERGPAPPTDADAAPDPPPPPEPGGRRTASIAIALLVALGILLALVAAPWRSPSTRDAAVEVRPDGSRRPLPVLADDRPEPRWTAPLDGWVLRAVVPGGGDRFVAQLDPARPRPSGNGGSRLVAFAPGGPDERWRTDAGGAVEHPFAHRDLVVAFVGGSGSRPGGDPSDPSGRGGAELVAWSVNAGTEVWRTPVGPRIPETALVVGDQVVVGASDRRGSIVVVDLADGARRWDAPGAAPAVGPDEVVAMRDGALAVHDLDDGTVRWRAEIATGLEPARPAVLGDVVAVAEPGARVVGFDRRSGERRWEHRADGPVVRVRAAAVTDVLLVETPGRVDALDADGTTRWTLPVEGEVLLTEGPGAARVTAITDGATVVLDAATGDEVARAVLPGVDAAWQLAPVRDGLVHVDAGAGGRVVAYDLATLEPRWSATLPGGPVDDVLLAPGGALVTVDATGRLHYQA